MLPVRRVDPPVLPDPTPIGDPAPVPATEAGSLLLVREVRDGALVTLVDRIGAEHPGRVVRCSRFVVAVEVWRPLPTSATEEATYPTEIYLLYSTGATRTGHYRLARIDAASVHLHTAPLSAGERSV